MRHKLLQFLVKALVPHHALMKIRLYRARYRSAMLAMECMKDLVLHKINRKYFTF